MTGPTTMHPSATTGTPDAAWKKLGRTLPPPVDAAERDDLLWQAFEAEFGWYHAAATRTRLGYQLLRLVVLLTGAAVTVAAGLSAASWLTASLAAVIVAAEGAQQLFQFHGNWISYRSTAERLRRHGLLYAARAEPYDGADRRDRLAQTLRAVTSKEGSAWAESMQRAASAGATAQPRRQ